ncbi:MAG: transcriptional regulator [Clostridia bacterium]|nr:transcriptional regulator [Clostridia bacterium]
MTRNEFIQICNQSVKSVRGEFSFSQEKMSNALGISKKTLVEIEKGRSSLGWSGSVTLCSVFGESRIICAAFGSDVVDTIRKIAFENAQINIHHANSTRIWWNTVYQYGGFIIEQNIVSQHYRLLSPDNVVLASSFDYNELILELNNIFIK